LYLNNIIFSDLLAYIVVIYNLYFLFFRVLLIRGIFKIKYIKGLNFDNVAIIGTGDEARLLAAKLIYDKDIDNRLIGFIGERSVNDLEVFGQYPVICNTNKIEQAIEKYHIKIVYIAEHSLPPEELLSFIKRLKVLNINIKLSSNLLFSGIGSLFGGDKISDYTVYKINNHFNSSFYLLLKRVIDFTLALVGIIILSPLFIAIGVLIKFSSPGPIVFSHQRIGKNGVTFSFYKFRSMVVGSDNDEIRMYRAMEAIRGNSVKKNDSTKIVNHYNITKVGRILRKYSLDELPQLVNVLFGQMSLVGPRPPIPYEVEAYKPWHKKRFTVKPGCTGLWQVLGRSKTNFDDMVVLDLYYIMNASAAMDLMIILKTFPVLIKGDGGE